MKNFLLSSLLLVFACASFGEETPEVEFEGVLIQRPDGSFMEFVLVENKINCRFFNAEKQPIDPDVDRVSIRMQRRQPRVRNVYAVAIPHEGGKGLRAPIFIEKPQIFQANLSLLRDGSDDAVEFYYFLYPDALSAAEPITVFQSE